MDLEFLIPIAFFTAVAYSIKVVVDARARAKLIAANVSEELLRSMMAAEEHQRRHSSLRWGIVLVCLSVGLGLIEIFNWQDVGPGAIALLIGATGIGNLAFYKLAGRNEPNRATA
jgi:hypothetical protein